MPGVVEEGPGGRDLGLRHAGGEEGGGGLVGEDGGALDGDALRQDEGVAGAGAAGPDDGLAFGLAQHLPGHDGARQAVGDFRVPADKRHAEGLAGRA